MRLACVIGHMKGTGYTRFGTEFSLFLGTYRTEVRMLEGPKLQLV